MTAATATRTRPKRKEAQAQAEALAWLDGIAQRSGRNFTEIAVTAGLSQTTLTQGRAGSRPLSAATLAAVAQAFSTPLPAGLAESLPPGRKRQQPSQAASRRTSARFVTTAEGADVGERVRLLATPSDLPAPFFRLNFAVVTDSAPRPAGIAHALAVYAFRMPDNGMAPWRRRNELVYADPGRHGGPGMHVLLRLAPRQDPNGMEAFTVARLEDLAGPGGTPRFLRYDRADAPFDLVAWRVAQTIPLLEIGDLLGP